VVVGTLLLRGLGAGLAAGLLSGAVALVTGEPQLDRAIALEAGAPGAGAADVVVSRDAQRVGLLVATALYGLALGGLFALAFAALRGRVGLSDRRTALALGAVGWLAVVAVPFLKYPANPPGVGDPGTVGARTALYLTMVAAGLLAALAAWRAARRVPEGRGTWARRAVGAGVFAGTVAVAWVVLPGAEPAPPGFPRDVLWGFRAAALLTQSVMWAALALLFAGARERAGAAGTAIGASRRRAP
jgi:hypothetical protein